MNKKLKLFLLVLTMVLMIACIGYYIAQKFQQKKADYFQDYTPQEEISEEQYRSTVVKLYFVDKNSQQLVAENRSVDAKTLILDPCLTLMNLLLEGPRDANLSSVIPSGTKVNQVTMQGNMAVVDLSHEFVDNHPGGAQQESATIYSIVNTLTQLTEVTSVKITIDQQENAEFTDHALSFSDPFVRK